MFMAKPRPPIVKRSIYSWIFGRNTKLQLVVLALIAVTVVARIIPLEMQNGLSMKPSGCAMIDLLIRYCAIYLVSVVAASGLKYLITVLQVMISQRTLARMRKGLFAHIISLPLSFFRNTQPGLVVSSLISELTIPANFVGMAVASPVINLLTLVGFAVYLFFLNPWLAALSLSIYPVVVFLVPLLQRRVNQANKKRVDKTRRPFPTRSRKPFPASMKCMATALMTLKTARSVALSTNSIGFDCAGISSGPA
jgi:ABC-type multidrug transport system fused ATPase/permease subunit